MKCKPEMSRREALKLAGSVALAAPVGGLLCSGVALAEEGQPNIDEGNPQAKGLGYKHDAASVDAAKYPAFAAGKTCANCQLYQGVSGADWGPCAIFPGYNVSAKGWCGAWVAKA